MRRRGCPAGPRAGAAPGRSSRSARANGSRWISSGAAHLAAAQPGAGHQHDDQPVPRRQASNPQQRGDLLVAGPVHRGAVLAQPAPGPQPVRHPALFPRGPAGRSGHRRLHTATGPDAPCCPAAHRVRCYSAHRGQYPVHPAGPARLGYRACQHQPCPVSVSVQAAGLRPGMPQPGHEVNPTRSIPHARTALSPGSTTARTNAIRCIRLRRQLRAVPANRTLTQERVRLWNHAQLISTSSPVPVRQPHRKRSTPIPVRVPQQQTMTSNKSITDGDDVEPATCRPVRNLPPHRIHLERTENSPRPVASLGAVDMPSADGPGLRASAAGCAGR